MTQYGITTRQGLPEDMQVLLRDYPRDAWPDHPNFAASIGNWMGAHQMFRNLAQLLETDTEARLEYAIDPDEYLARLARFGNILVRNLHGHHGWEDHSFFPELSAADNRFGKGLDMLENDHLEMDRILEQLTGTANRYLQLSHLSPADADTELGQLHSATSDIKRFLARHLSDEEELVIPILLHHKLRG